MVEIEVNVARYMKREHGADANKPGNYQLYGSVSNYKGEGVPIDYIAHWSLKRGRI